MFKLLSLKIKIAMRAMSLRVLKSIQKDLAALEAYTRENRVELLQTGLLGRYEGEIQRQRAGFLEMAKLGLERSEHYSPEDVEWLRRVIAEGE